MSRYVALLRAINVGGRNVKMEALREQFLGLGFAQVETYLASGNLLFESQAHTRAGLQARIETALQRSLGFAVDCFLRDPAQMVNVGRLAAEGQARPGIIAMNVGFLHEPLDANGERLLRSYRSDQDDFELQGREIYWSCACKQSDSKFQPATLERALKMPITFRGANTCVQLAARLQAHV